TTTMVTKRLSGDATEDILILPELRDAHAGTASLPNPSSEAPDSQRQASQQRGGRLGDRRNRYLGRIKREGLIQTRQALRNPDPQLHVPDTVENRAKRLTFGVDVGVARVDVEIDQRPGVGRYRFVISDDDARKTHRVGKAGNVGEWF